MPNVTMPNGDVVAFPDDMPRENIRALITKKFPTAEREAAANSGARPYDNALQTMGKAVQGTPGNIQLGVSGVSEMARTGGAGDPNALIDKLGPDFTLSERPGIDEANLIQWGRKQIGADTATPLTPEQRRQIEALARTPGAGQAFSSYLSDPDSIRVGSSPEVVAKESLRGQLERKEIGKSIPAIDARPGSAEELAANVTSSVAQMAPGYLATAITRNPLPTVALAQTLTTGQAYGQARDAGLEPSKAAEYAMTNGFAEAVGEALPLGMILKEGGGKLLPKLFKAGAAEGLQESVTQFIQSMLQSGSITPDMTWGDVKNQVIQAAATGAVAGGVLTAATSGVEAIANRGRGGQPSPEEVSAEVLNPPASATDPAVPDDTVAIEDMLALPAPGVMLALPAPSGEPVIERRQPPAPTRAAEPVPPTESELSYQAQLAARRTRQTETAELLKTARETVTPLGTFDRSELPGDAAQRVGVWRQRLGKAIDGPISIEDMARARVPQSQIDAAIALRRPLTEGVTVSPSEVRLAAEQRNIIATDGNFKELAYRATGGRDLDRMTQAQLKALKSTLEAMPTHATPVTLPLAEASPFTEGQYSKGLDAVRTQGRFTLKAVKDATGLTSDKDARAIRDAMVRRGQLVQRSASDYRLYDIAGAERQAVPDDLPKGAFSEHVVKRLPVSRIQIRQNGKSIGSFGSGAEARSKIRDLRAAEAEKGGTPSQIELSHGDEAAFGVMENRYDAEGNLLGQVVVDTARDESAARALADQRNNPVAAPTFEGPFTTHLPRGGRIMDAPAPRLDVNPTPRRAPPAALAGRIESVLAALNKTAATRGLPLLGTKVSIKHDLTAPDGAPVKGVYLRNLINLTAANLTPSMNDAEVIDSLTQVMDHELIHALKHAGVLSPESDGWKTIARYAARTRRPNSTQTYMEWADQHYAGLPGYETSEDRQEEAIAEAFRVWAANRRDVVGKPATVFRQLVEWFRNVLNRIPKEVFSAIETGQLVRDALTPPGASQPRARNTKDLAEARAGIAAAQAAGDAPAVVARSRQFLRARAQSREDRYGRSGPKTVLGTTPSRAFESAERPDRSAIDTITERYRQQAGLAASGLSTYLPEDRAYLTRLADAQQKGVHNPEANDVAKAYRSLVTETRAMFDALGDLTVEPWQGDGAPYSSPAAMLADVTAGRLKMRLTDEMFGPSIDYPHHPMNEPSGRAASDGRPLTNNDLFRVVHDIYGRGPLGLRGSARDEYNAYHEHARLLSPEARRALATETLAQSAWHNLGPHLRRPDGTVPRPSDVDFLPGVQKEFSEQKAFLVPEALIAADPGWALADDAARAQEDGDLPKFMVAYHGTPHRVDKFSLDKINTGEGAQAFGWGLYFAGKKEVAEWYRNVLSKRKSPDQFKWRGFTYGLSNLTDVIAQETAVSHYDVAVVLGDIIAGRTLAESRASVAGNSGPARVIDYLETQPPVERAAGPTPGNLYKVDVPEDSELLDYDAKLKDQPPAVRDALTSLGIFRPAHIIEDKVPAGLFKSKIQYRVADRNGRYEVFQDRARAEEHRELMDKDLMNLTGAQLYQKLSDGYMNMNRKMPKDFGMARKLSEKQASEKLREIGIPGHRYFDGGSRAAGDGTRNYVVYDENRIQILEENPKFSRFADDLPGGRMYGNPNRSPGGALSKPGTPSPAFTAERDGNRFFGGEMADEQLRMAREGVDGATLLYLSPDDFLALADQRPNPEQAVYDATIDAGYKLSLLPSLVLDGYAGNVRVVGSDSVAGVRALAGKTDAIPVAIYPKRKENLGLVTALEANGVRVPWPATGRAENFPDVRGPRYSVDTERFKEWFGDSKVVNADGSPRVVYHGTRNPDFSSFSIARAGSRTDEGYLGKGVYFSAEASTASIYAGDGAVYPTFLSLQNPLVIAAEMDGRRERDRSVVVRERLSLPLDATAWDVTDAARLAGYDGVEYRDPYGGTEYIAFEPTQIKSAISNNGQYSATDPDIRYSLSAPFGTRVPPDQPTFNIIGQRVEGYVGKTLANIGRSKRPIPFIGSVFDLRIKQQDKMLSVKEMIENIEAMGGKVGDDTNTYMVEQLAGSRTVHQVEHREETLYEPLFAGLKAAASGPNPVTVKQFEDFLYARHAPERNTYLRARGSKVANPSGMSDSEAGAILDKFALAGQLGTLERLAVLADAISANTTATRLDAGLISDKAANGSPYKHYIPLRGKTEEDLDPEDVYDPQTRARSGKGYTVGGKEDRSATGRERKAGDLISHLVLQNTESVIRAEKNRVALSFMRLIADNPQTGYGTILESVPTRTVVGANGMIREAGDPSYRQRPDVFTAKYKGAEIVAQVGDPRVARAMKSDYVTQSGAFINALGRLNRYLATINTSWNPEFLVSNIARDLQTAGLLGAQYDIKGLPGKIIKGAPAAVVGIREVLRDGTATTPMALAFRELQEAGGTTEFMGIHDLETHIKRLRKDAASTGLNTTARQAWQHVQNLGKFIDDYNKVAENAFRLSSYVAARDAGASVDKAAYLAKNLTINFNKGGENKATMNALYLFYNASISGTFVLLNGLKSKRVQKLVAGIVAAGFIQDLITRAMSGDEDDNGVKDYDDIPDYVLQNNWVFMTGGKNYVSVPMPYGFNVFHNMGRNLSNAFSGSPVHNPGKSALSMVTTALSAFNPMGGSNSALNFIAPTIVDPLVDLVSNRDFAGNSIVPERPSFGVPVPDSQKYWSNTGEIPKWIAEHLNAMTGGNDLRKGWIDYSPEVLQYWFDYATGATGKFITRNINTAQKTLQGDFEDIKIGDIPFARRVVGTVDNRGNTERYYENATQVQTVAAELKLATEKGDATLGRSTLANYPAEVRLIDTFDKGEKALAEMRKEIRAIKDAPSLPEAKKREATKQIREQQDRVMAQLNKIYFAQKAATGQR